MMGILSLVPIKDWIYLGIIVTVLGLFGWYTAHERNIGKAEILASDQRAVDAKTVHDDEVSKRANILVKQALSNYKANMVAPIAPSSIPKLLCYASKPLGSSHLPANGGSSGGSNGTAEVPDANNNPFDPAPEIVADGRDADAQVLLLQQYILICQNLGKCAK